MGEEGEEKGEREWPLSAREDKGAKSRGESRGVSLTCSGDPKKSLAAAVWSAHLNCCH